MRHATMEMMVPRRTTSTTAANMKKKKKLKKNKNWNTMSPTSKWSEKFVFTQRDFVSSSDAFFIFSIILLCMKFETLTRTNQREMREKIVESCRIMWRLNWVEWMAALVDLVQHEARWSEEDEKPEWSKNCANVQPTETRNVRKKSVRNLTDKKNRTEWYSVT